MRRVLRNNGLSIVMFVLFLVFWVGQSVAGWLHENDERRQHGQPPESWSAFLTSGEFLESTFENWESEFFQMACFVVLAGLLYQKGASDSRDPDDPEARRKEEEKVHRDSPGPVLRGGLALKVYGHSLSLALFLLFGISFLLHGITGLRKHNEEAAQHGEAAMSVGQYFASPAFWFESLQNWQSEFLAVAVLVVLSIFLRERSSPQSKPVPMPHAQTEG